ncbi:unnamed protein product [Rodentolepis nana]|uniref:Uncharacterized protein n=1 Tax=Rodentolepis nana TaxID=102285 RepID=A0A3P7S3B8_RODNA|nr:unnamed protein product [Rodentolepis nana]
MSPTLDFERFLYGYSVLASDLTDDHDNHPTITDTPSLSQALRIVHLTGFCYSPRPLGGGFHQLPLLQSLAETGG